MLTATERPRAGVPLRQGAAVVVHACCMARQSSALPHRHFVTGKHDRFPLRLSSGQHTVVRLGGHAADWSVAQVGAESAEGEGEEEGEEY